jgi:SNF2 family DNA or RNA helicase
MTAVYLHLAGDKLLISFDYNKYLNSELKKIPGTRWNKEWSRWEAPISLYKRLLDVLDDVKISNAVMNRLRREAEAIRQVEELRKKDYHELTDYSPKIPLMSHQKKAFELHRMIPGSGNFSEMGSGKTGSAICIAHWHLEMGNIDKCLVVCPKSVIRGWEEQIEMFSDLTYVSITGVKKEDRLKKLDLKRDIYLINYEYTWRITDLLLKQNFGLVIADEAHRIKNPQSNQSKACYKLSDNAQYSIALTGTPVLNSSLDAFGVMRFIDPTVFGESYYSFRSRYFKNVGPENSPIQIFIAKHGADKEISDKIYTKALRFLKEECMDLPIATHLPDRVIYLSRDQDKAYRNLQEQLSAQITETKSIKINHVLSLMLKLNQITSGWIKDSETGEIIHFKSNPKFEELKNIVEEAGDQPLILWAYYRADMKLITDYYGRCRKCKTPINNINTAKCPGCHTLIQYRCSEVQGSTKHRNAEIAKFRLTTKERAELRKKFVEEGKTPAEIRAEIGDTLPDGSEPPQTNIIVCQCVAASEGLNLQRSTMSIFYSRNWSLKDWTQALARNHRKGQTKRVTYINLVAKMANGDDTIDQRIVNALKAKENLSKRVNKDDIKLLTGNFRKKDREAFQDIKIDDSDAVVEEPEDISAGDPSNNKDDNSNTEQKSLF